MCIRDSWETSKKEYTATERRLQLLQEELCRCQEVYLGLGKGPDRKAVKHQMKEIDRECKALRAQVQETDKDAGPIHEADCSPTLSMEHQHQVQEPLPSPPSETVMPLRLSKSTPSSPTHATSQKNQTLTPKGTGQSSAGAPSGWLAAKSAVPIVGLAGARTKAGSLSELIKQRKANKVHQNKSATFSETSSPDIPAEAFIRHVRKMSA
eukprot:TRINITY_DN61156_c0_g1_i1.p1 TRINITY_DN61156_c0_g1~~TRINITY_DN61156_c0_g1_i1.p1  ORF type:complete len:209 (-),score=51.34 TRINITY_DN61156_c0_g1_i1:310-936(-)